MVLDVGPSLTVLLESNGGEPSRGRRVRVLGTPAGNSAVQFIVRGDPTKGMVELTSTLSRGTTRRRKEDHARNGIRVIWTNL